MLLAWGLSGHSFETNYIIYNINKQSLINQLSMNIVYS